MQEYVVKEIDIFTKQANIYMDGELVISFPYNPNHPKRCVFDQIISGSTPLHIIDWNQIPTIGMIYQDGDFLDGQNGETFLSVNEQDVGFPLCDGVEAIVTLSSNNVVDGTLVLLINMFADVVEDWEAMFAALMSNATIIIEDYEYQGFFFSPDQVGTTVSVPVWPDDFYGIQ